MIKIVEAQGQIGELLGVSISSAWIKCDYNAYLLFNYVSFTAKSLPIVNKRALMGLLVLKLCNATSFKIN